MAKTLLTKIISVSLFLTPAILASVSGVSFIKNKQSVIDHKLFSYFFVKSNSDVTNLNNYLCMTKNTSNTSAAYKCQISKLNTFEQEKEHVIVNQDFLNSPQAIVKANESLKKDHFYFLRAPINKEEEIKDENSVIIIQNNNDKTQLGELAVTASGFGKINDFDINALLLVVEDHKTKYADKRILKCRFFSPSNIAKNPFVCTTCVTPPDSSKQKETWNTTLMTIDFAITENTVKTKKYSKLRNQKIELGFSAVNDDTVRAIDTIYYSKWGLIGDIHSTSKSLFFIE